MARYDFGGTLADFVVTSRRLGGLDVLGLSAATLTFWSAQTGGTRYTDLVLNGSAVSSISVSTDGQVPKFQGPDGVTEMWVDGGSPRVRVVTLQGAPGPAGKDGANGLPGVNAVPADSAVATYVAGPSSTATALAGAYSAKKSLPVNIMDFAGVDPTGATASTAAFEAAANTNRPVFLPKGTYLYDGAGIAASTPMFWGEDRGAVTVNLAAGSRFIDANTAWTGLYIHGIKFNGGVDVIRNRWTAGNVQGQYIVDRCHFAGYTGAAISHNASDMPYWKITRNMFVGANYTSTVGVAITGLTDGCTIEDNEFLANRVHIKIGNGGNNAYLAKNDFIRFGATQGSPRIDVWVVPHTATTNAGPGFVLERSKFGNENLDAADYRIVYADQGTGSYFGERMPVLNADSTGYIFGHTVTNVLLNGIGGTPIPLVYSTTPNVRGCSYGPVEVAGNTGASLLTFRTAPPADRGTIDNIVGPILGADVGTETTLVGAPTGGTGSGRVLDPQGLFSTRAEEPLAQRAGDPVDYVPLLSTGIRSFTLGGGATRANVADAYGGTDAAEVTFGTGSLTYAGLTLGSLVVGRPVWIEFDVSAGSTTPLADMRVFLQYTSNGAIHFRRVVSIPASGTVRHRFLWTPREKTAAINLGFDSKIQAGLVKIGRVRAYHSREPLNVDGYTLVNGTATKLAARDELWVPATAFTTFTGAPSYTPVSGTQVMWALDSAATERVGGVVDFPRHWATYNVDLYWTNLGAGVGDVRWELATDFASNTGSIVVFTSLGQSVITAPAQNVLKVSSLATGATIPASGVLPSLNVTRYGADATDTLPNDAGLLALRLTKAS